MRIRTGKEWIRFQIWIWIQVISLGVTEFFKFLVLFFCLFLSENLMNHLEMRKFL